MPRRAADVSYLRFLEKSDDSQEVRMAQGQSGEGGRIVSRYAGDQWDQARVQGVQEGYRLGWEQACHWMEREMGTTVPSRVKGAWAQQWQAQAGTLPTSLPNLPSGVTRPQDQGDTVAG